MFINEWMGKQIVAYICNGMLFSHKKEQSTILQVGWTSKTLQIKESRYKRPQPYRQKAD